MKYKTSGPLLIAATAILWSFGGLLISLIEWPPITIVGMRAAFAAIVLAAYMRKPRITFSPSVILGAVCMAGTTILYVIAIDLTGPVNSIVLQYTAPIFIIVLSMIVQKKRPKALDVIAVLVTFAGILLFFVNEIKGNDAKGLLGCALAILSGVTFAGVFFINQMPGAKPEESLLLGHLINIVIGLPFILTTTTFNPTSWIAITLLGVFQLGLAYVLFSIGIKRTPPITASLIAALEPLLNPVWVLLFLPNAKPLGPYSIVGGMIVLLAVVLYSILSARQNKTSAVRQAGAETSA